MKNYSKPNLRSNQTVMDHNAFLKRIKKTLYYGPSIPKHECMSLPMAEYASEIFSETHKGHSLNRLNFVTAGKLNVAPCSLILAIIYLDRLKDADPEYAKRITPTELFLISMMVSTKFYCGYDESIYMSDYAELGDIPVDILKKMELEFLNALNWNAYVSNEEFFEKLKKLELSLARQQSLRRGWMTYTEMLFLFPSFDIMKEMFYCNLILACSYVIGVMTIAGAFLIASHVPGTLLYTNKSTNLEKPTTITNNKTNLIIPNQEIETGSPTIKVFDKITNIQDNSLILLNESELEFHERNYQEEINCFLPQQITNKLILNESLLFYYKNNYEKFNFWDLWSYKKFII